MALSDGYKAIMFEIRTAWDGHDLWGTVMSNLFGLATAAFVEYDEILPGFSPGPMLDRNETLEDYPDARFQELIKDGTADLSDVEAVYAVLSRYADLVPEDRKY